MDLSDLWDWTFMWQMIRNFTATFAPFIMIVVAVAVTGMVLGIVVGLVMKMRSR